jgi:hypothetical protein
MSTSKTYRDAAMRPARELWGVWPCRIWLVRSLMATGTPIRKTQTRQQIDESRPLSYELNGFRPQGPAADESAYTTRNGITSSSTTHLRYEKDITQWRATARR